MGDRQLIMDLAVRSTWAYAGLIGFNPGQLRAPQGDKNSGSGSRRLSENFPFFFCFLLNKKVFSF